MGPYDRDFDRDGDGELDFFERYERDDFDDMLAKRGFYAEDDEDGNKGLLDDELELAGLDRDELEMMDDDERDEALEDAGIDSDEWDVG